jgi:hypothetical protein
LILVDSSVWVDYFKGTVTRQTDKLDGLLGQDFVAIGDLILTEVLQGFDNDRDFNAARELLTSLTVVELGGRERARPGATAPATVADTMESTESTESTVPDTMKSRVKSRC